MSANPLKMISSMATREVVNELAARFERETGQAVWVEAAGGVDVAKRVAAGEVVDVVVLASNAIDQLIADGKVMAGSRVDLVKSSVAIAVRAGAPQPDISTEEAVRHAVLGAKTLSYSTGPSGVYLEKLFERWGILAQIRERIVVPPPGKPVGSLVASGVAELGFQQLSELMNLQGIQVLGPLPPAIQTITTFSGGIASISTRRDAARAFLQSMTTPAATDVKKQHGMDAA